MGRSLSRISSAGAGVGAVEQSLHLLPDHRAPAPRCSSGVGLCCLLEEREEEGVHIDGSCEVAAPKSRPADFLGGRVLVPGIYRNEAHSCGPGRLLCLDCRERRC
jgi:hypothetical protein